MDRLPPNAANSCPLTPLGFLDRAATVYGDIPSVVYNSIVYTWSETRQRCLRLASALGSLGITSGDVVSVLAPNVPAMYEAQFGVPMSGAVLNNINTRLDARTISILLQHGGSKLVLVDRQLVPLLNDALRLFSLDQKQHKVIVIEDPYLDSTPTTSDGGNPINYEKLIEMGDPEFEWVRPKSEWDPVVLNYTSGTTSAPKGVVHCHRSLFVMTLNCLVDWPLPNGAVYLWTLPLFHGNGWSFPFGMAAVGGTNVCLRHLDAGAIYSAIQEHKVTHMCGAPVVLNMLTNAPESIRKPLPGPVHVMTGGAPPPAAMLFRAEKLGFEVKHAYGLTETGGPAVSCAWKGKWDQLPAEDRARLKARQGVGMVGMAAADVVDKATGRPVARDGAALGEMVLKGACVTLGYLKNEAATTAAIGDWFYTGDVAVVHPDGYIEIKDRSKDVIISGGENISSVEVEAVLYGHPAVGEAAVVARPDEKWGETPCAFVSVKEGVSVKPKEAEIIGYCREKMAHYMVPKTVVFMAELPKTSTGKILKYLLREKAKQLGVAPPSRL